MLKIEMLPARNGDALWIEYGDAESPRRIIVDGGTEGSFEDGLRARIESLPAGERRFELLVVTHVDSDHIAGVLELVRDDALGATYGDVWFNAWRHLPATVEELGPVEGELLTRAADGLGIGAWSGDDARRIAGHEERDRERDHAGAEQDHQRPDGPAGEIPHGRQSLTPAAPDTIASGGIRTCASSSPSPSS